MFPIKIEKLSSETFFKKMHIFQEISLVRSLCYILYIIILHFERECEWLILNKYIYCKDTSKSFFRELLRIAEYINSSNRSEKAELRRGI